MKVNHNQDTNFLKLVAAFAMVIDHIGLMFYPNIYLFRIIGRISYPLFSYCLMIGYFNTSDYKKYIIRLFIFAIICQFPYTLLVNNIYELNIIFTLVMQLLIFYALDKKKYNVLYILLLSLFINFSYNIVYIILSLMYYYFRNNKLLLTIGYTSFYSIYLIGLDKIFMIPFFSIFALPFILINPSFNIKTPKYFFYYFYPTHILILYLISIVF